MASPLLPDAIQFVSGLHRGISFRRGTGKNIEVVRHPGGLLWRLDDPYIWYACYNRAVDASYLLQNRKNWIKIPA
jgi:hypothetical protein